MGVKNLWDILESCKKTLPLHHLQNKRVCIDLSCWMVQLHNVNKSHCSLKDRLYLKGLFHRLRALIAMNCSLILVTDGSIPAIKLSTYRRRLKSGSEATQDETNSLKVTSLRRNMGSEFSCMIKEAKLLGVALGIPCLDGVEEAEAQCALLNSESLCDGCFTSDSDIFLFGARTVYRDICLGEGGYVVCYEMADIEKKLGFGRNSLITLAILLGSDYSPGVRGLGPESACRIVKSVGDSAILQQIASEGLSFAKKLKGSRKQGHIIRCSYKENESDHEMKINGSEPDLQGEDQFLQVIDAYLKPKCHSGDSEAVHRVLALYPFQRTNIQQICTQFFDWPPEKTDEYILPKIAERDLRRFANLRSTSSELGLGLPLDKMPVKCPVSGIIKQRKIQGQDCLEVSWEEMHGLNTSIVPADLIERACPEKILEFEERRAQRNKPNHRKPRTKKSENRAPMKEIDLKLQDLLLDIEQESSASQRGNEPKSRNAAVIKGDLMNKNLRISTKSKGNIESNNAADCYTTGSSVATMEVIDLLSPSPPVHGRIVSRCQQANVECIDMIDLSESETEASPEHTRKARELRLFLDSIRKDIS
ncbi:flap endonuclease GEN-like 2 [Camellia sinensis]|uniref:flap endonuclease GEN-like 2 n=1 Tax=Camellia sinensis TaxID=4442 RepID=UPI001036A21D|nr:flap endonuclease GEN-like 2 [Camellia sinensis]